MNNTRCVGKKRCPVTRDLVKQKRDDVEKMGIVAQNRSRLYLCDCDGKRGEQKNMERMINGKRQRNPIGRPQDRALVKATRPAIYDHNCHLRQT